jgi:hypothetical protein
MFPFESTAAEWKIPAEIAIIDLFVTAAASIIGTI